MRAAVLTLALILSAPPALAQTAIERPETPAPEAAAPFEMREDLCQAYAAWFIERQPALGAAPVDVAPTHRFEVEFNSCKLDPREYERQTLAELAEAEQRS